jgi:microcystin degradation protein MlrC
MTRVFTTALADEDDTFSPLPIGGESFRERGDLRRHARR